MSEQNIAYIEVLDWDIAEQKFHTGAATVQAALEFMTPGEKIRSTNLVSENITFGFMKHKPHQISVEMFS